MGENLSLESQALAVLDKNFRGDHTVPNEGLYPNQWFWDSCFISIGLRHTDIERAKTELETLVDGQWDNGMFPHIIFSPGNRYYARDIWDSSRSKDAPKDVETSGITQPPMLAEAIVRVGEKLGDDERKKWYKDMYQPLVRYHEWLYRERDPRTEGLVTVVHSWESGMDNTPPWMTQLDSLNRPLWLNQVRKNEGLHRLVKPFLDDWRQRRDGKHVSAEERLSTPEMIMVYYAAKVLRRQKYESETIIKDNPLALQDLAFNAILARANTHLLAIAEELGEKLSPELAHNIGLTNTSLEMLWDPVDEQYYSRRTQDGSLVREPTVANFLPLYSGAISQVRAQQLVEQLHDSDSYGTPFPVPTVPTNSPSFEAGRYWKGPSWININWLITQGLEQYGYKEEAKTLGKQTLNLVENSGFSEYFDPLTGDGKGAGNFSWTAALTIDLLHEQE